MGFFARLSKIRISVGSSSLQVDPAVQAERDRQAFLTRPLHGPAGVAVHGDGPVPEPAYSPPPPKFTEPARQADHERHQRDAARAPYASSSRTAVTITRIASRHGDGTADVCAHLAATGLSARPDLVFGVYRLPDHIGRNATSGRRYVEWDVVHAPHGALPPGPPPQSLFLDARRPWVARASGEPSVLDEDLAVVLLQRAGVPPEEVLGLARQVVSTAGGGGGANAGGSLYARMAVSGIHVLCSSRVDVAAAAARLAADAPLGLPHGAPPGVHTEVLNWRAIAKAVAPRTGTPFLVPSPFPYLPSTPQELLIAHLDVVGVSPADCLGAQVTIDREIDVLDREGGGWASAVSNVGRPQPCVDGEDRPRLAGATHVVVAYRDRPEYAERRGRWTAYQRDVLRADLAKRTGARRPVPPMDLGSLNKGLRSTLQAAGAVTAFVTGMPGGPEKFDEIPDARYCWPPTDAR